VAEKMTRCPEGHYFDPSKHSSCPWCPLPREAGEQKTRLDPSHAGPTPLSGPAAAAATVVPIAGAALRLDPSVLAGLRNEPVVGWLVCLAGPDRGRDYRLHAEKNFVGRAPHMDVVIAGDPTVSREKHGVVVYDPKKKSFWVLPGEASRLVYLNGEMVNSPLRMESGDVIELGQTKLVLVAFCGDHYDWSES
jgi:hypothetical protein